MKKVYIFSLFLLIMGCDGFNDAESPYIEKYVVFANLSGNQAMINDTVFVSRSASLDETIAVSYTHLTLPTIYSV